MHGSKDHLETFKGGFVPPGPERNDYSVGPDGRASGGKLSSSTDSSSRRYANERVLFDQDDIDGQTPEEAQAIAQQLEDEDEERRMMSVPPHLEDGTEITEDDSSAFDDVSVKSTSGNITTLIEQFNELFSR